MKKKRTSKQTKILKGLSGKIIIGTLLALLIIVAGIAMFTQGYIENPLADIRTQEQIIEARDYCSVVAGNLIHTIQNEEDCTLQCFAECETRELDFKNSEFIPLENNCNECTCSCQ